MNKILLCALSATLCGLASPNTNYHFLVWVSLIPFLETLRGQNSRQGFGYGWLCGFMMHLVNFHWLIGTVHRFSNLNLFFSVLTWILFAWYSGLALGATAALFQFVQKRTSLPGLIVFPAGYAAMEYLFPFIFPWHLGAFLYQKLIWVQISDIFGIYGVTFLVVSINHFLWEVLGCLQKTKRFPFSSLAVTLIMVTATLAYGQGRISAIQRTQDQSTPVIVGIVQPNILIEEMDDQLKQKDIWNRFRSLSKEAARQGAQLIIWPESAINFAYNPKGLNFSSSGLLKSLVQDIDRPILFGSWAYGPDGIRNRAYLLNPDGSLVGSYDKVKLLPFGEYLPLAEIFPFLNSLIQGPGDFHAGQQVSPLCWEDVCFGVLICFEGTIKDISRKQINKGAAFLVNITNDAWFGNTRCPEQHLMLASFRAIENRVWLVRAANTGVSALVEPTGRIDKRTPLYEQAVRVDAINMQKIPTLYKQWGDWFPITCLVFFGIATLQGLFKQQVS